MANKVLLIDDDIDEHEIFTRQLAEYNHNIKVISAYDGFEAFKILKKTSPDCIFLDINMPKLNGLQVLKKLKEDKSAKNIPVYIYSTSDGYHSKQPAIKLGAVFYFKKPSVPEDLYKIFKIVFDHTKDN